MQKITTLNWCAVHQTHIFPVIRSKINGSSKLPVSFICWSVLLFSDSFFCVSLLRLSPKLCVPICQSVVVTHRRVDYNRPFFVFVQLIFDTSDAPRVSVHLANEEPIPSRLIVRAERENVTIKCRSDANPPADSFKWFKNVSNSALFFLLVPYLQTLKSNLCI